MSDQAVPLSKFEADMERNVELYKIRCEINIQIDWMKHHFHTTQGLICRMGDHGCSEDSKRCYAMIIKERVEDQVREASKLQGDLMRLLDAIEKKDIE